MNKREAQVFTAYTGLLFGKFEWFHEYAEQQLRRSLFTHEFANAELMEQIKQISEEEFIKINTEVTE